MKNEEWEFIMQKCCLAIHQWTQWTNLSKWRVSNQSNFSNYSLSLYVINYNENWRFFPVPFFASIYFVYFMCWKGFSHFLMWWQFNSILMNHWTVNVGKSKSLVKHTNINTWFFILSTTRQISKNRHVCTLSETKIVKLNEHNVFCSVLLFYFFFGKDF